MGMTESKGHSEKKWDFWIDTGGTFTDCLSRSPEGVRQRVKVLSNSSIRARFLGHAGRHRVRVKFDHPFPEGFFIGFTCTWSDGDFVQRVLHWDPATTELTLQGEISSSGREGDLLLLQFSGEAPELAARWATGTRGDQPLPPSRLRLATTKGTNALLERKGGRTVMIIDRGLKDLLHIHNQQRPDLFALNIQRPSPLHERVIEVEFQNDKLLNPEAFEEACMDCLAEGIDCGAIVLMHSWKDTVRERTISKIMRRLGFHHLTLSGECVPFIKILDRAETTLANTSLSPILNGYLDNVAQAFGKEGLSVMTSAGGLIPRTAFQPKDSLVSGPAGGVVGASHIGEQAGFPKIIGFDMGGTSTDVSRYAHALDYQHLSKVGDIRVVAPSLRIETVAAGGGSMCIFDGNRLRVGPESAGAQPGPACYGTGGPLTVTDVNLLLGRVDADRFGIPIDPGSSRGELERLRKQLTDAGKPTDSEETLLSGLLAIANENMAEAIHKVSTAQGYAPSEYALIAFGGAGGQHACAIAEKLGIETVLFPENAGLLSAYGLEQAVEEGIADLQCFLPYQEFLKRAPKILQSMEAQATESMPVDARNFAQTHRVILGMRLQAQDSSIEVDFIDGEDLLEQFLQQFEEIYGYRGHADKVEVVTVRVVVNVPGEKGPRECFEQPQQNLVSTRLIPSFVQGKWRKVPVFSREQLSAGTEVRGPAIIQDAFSTFYVEPGWSADKGSAGTVRITHQEKITVEAHTSEAVELELFTNRFQSLVENMGYRLQRTALSPNVKERLDFSCALLDSQGGLVVNAPHIPVHLGALGACVRAISKQHTWKPGDMIVTNHPGFGGSHLPDVTTVTSLWDEEKNLIGFLTNRAHHAEMGGIAPGSMPPHAKNLEEEGVVIPPTLIMRDGALDLEPVRALLTHSRFPSRQVDQNLADLNAQIASLLKGKSEFQTFQKQWGSLRLLHYMNALQYRATQCVANRLRTMPDGVYNAEQHLDDGSALVVKATVSGETLHLDFEGSAPVHRASYNATPGIVASAVIYFLRVWVNEPIPLNEGLMKPITIHLPEGLLNPPFPDDPSKCPPVVAGNVETSQRLVDTLFLAFELCACSQGTMNNLIFGNEDTSFYETISGGSGAGDGYDGESGVHVHMTNTGITDPEILEQRFPVKLREFSLRCDSGGEGKYRGGEGVIRDLEFLEPVTLSLLTQHRKEQPYGLKGGQAGACGEQFLIRKNEAPLPLEGNTTLSLSVGDRIRILTPGGGGYGRIVVP